VNILDENIPDSQRQLLKKNRIRVQQIGEDVGRKGIKDDEIIRLLHQLDRPTFFTLDGGFYQSQRCHERYCLVHRNVAEEVAAKFVRRLLSHPRFNSRAKRMGLVIRAAPQRVSCWQIRRDKQQFVSRE